MSGFLSRYLKTHWKPLLLMTVIWLLLELPAVFGYQSVLFYPLYFLTGALSGITGGGILGMIFGAVGRAIIYVFFEQFLIILFFSKLPAKERLTQCGKILKDKLEGLIPYFQKLKGLISKDYKVLSAEAAGFGAALIISQLLSGSGTIRNSFVSLVLFIQITKELSSRSGLIFSLTKLMFRKLGKKEPETDFLKKYLSAHALGYVVGPVLPGKNIACWLGFAFLAAAAVLYFMPAAKTEPKAEAKEEEKNE